ncbi:MAG: metallophosphoesterase [Phycisphaerales bacterium]
MSEPGRSFKYRKARIRRFLFTHGPDRLSRGRLRNRHIKRDIVVREVQVHARDWPKELDGLRIGHISDLHLGDLLPLKNAQAAVELLAEQQPDVIACTGDVIDLELNDESRLILETLAQAGAPFGSLLVLGNHDELVDGNAFSAMARDAGMTVLENEQMQIVHNARRLNVAGIRWGRTLAANSQHVSETLGHHDADHSGNDPVHLLLAHNPKAFRQASKLGVPLTLAGHTHGGQIALRGRPNTNLALTHRRSAGLFEKDGSQLFVTTGLGAWFPIRVHCPPEIVIIAVHGVAD